MISLSHLNKLIIFVFFLLIFFSKFSLAEEEPVDIWKSQEDQKNDIGIQSGEQEIKIENSVLLDDEQKTDVTIDEDYIGKSNSNIIGIFDPEDNNFDLNMWSLTDGEDIKKILKRIDKLKLSKLSEDLLFRILYQNALEVIFLDDGLNLLVFKENFQVKDYKLFSYFNLNNKRVIKNNFNFLKTTVKNNSISSNEIWLLGTPASTFGILDNNVYNSLIKEFAEKYKDKKIFFFPHRDEEFYETNLPKNIIVKNKLIEPIEIYASKQKNMPFLIAGFYTTALHILNMILDRKKITFMNINFNTNLINTKKLKERYNLINLKQQYDLVTIILKENSIRNFI